MKSATAWRKQLGNWKNTLRHLSRGLAEGSSKLAERGLVPDTAKTGLERSTLTATLRGLADLTDKMTCRIEATLQILLLSSLIVDMGSNPEEDGGEEDSGEEESQSSSPPRSPTVVEDEGSDLSLAPWPHSKGFAVSDVDDVPGDVDSHDGISPESPGALSVGTAHRALEA